MSYDPRIADIADKLDAVFELSSKIHTAIFGVEGQGGLFRQVEKQQSDIQVLRTDLNKFQQEIGAERSWLRGKVAGVTAALSILVTAAWHLIQFAWSAFHGQHK